MGFQAPKGATRGATEDFDPRSPAMAGPIIEELVPADSQFVPTNAKSGFSRYRPGIATTLPATPVGASGVKAFHTYDAETAFALDLEHKRVPPPQITQQPRRSTFQEVQRHRFQFHINPAWGRHPGRYARFSFINLIASTGNSAATLAQDRTRQGMRPQKRFTRVLNYPRQNAEPSTYSPTEGYGP